MTRPRHLNCECARSFSPPVDEVVFTAPGWFAHGDALQEAAETTGIHVPLLLENAGAEALRAVANRQQWGF